MGNSFLLCFNLTFELFLNLLVVFEPGSDLSLILFRQTQRQ